MPIFIAPHVGFSIDYGTDYGTHQHECSTPGCGAWEGCSDIGSDDRCSRPDAGWIGGRFYCKDCAEDLLT